MKKSVVLSIALLVVITAAAFWPCLHNGFTNYDDDFLLTRNPVVQGMSFEKAAKVFSPHGHNGLYVPLTLMSFSLEYAFFGLDSWVYHFTNLLLHVLNTVLVFWLVWLLSRRLAVSFCVALLFGIHPAHVESVAWVAERKDVLFAFFLFLSAIAYLYFRKTGRLIAAVLSLVAFTLSLLAKQTGIVLPVILLLFDMKQRGKIGVLDVLGKVPFFLVAAVFGFIALNGHHAALLRSAQAPFLSLENFSVSSYSLLFCLEKLFWPTGLSCFYPFPSLQGQGFYLPFMIAFLVVVGVTVMALWRCCRRNDDWSFGWLFYFLTIAPIVVVMPYNTSIAFDHYAYVPSIGIFFAVVMFVVRFYDKCAVSGGILRFLLIAVVGLVFLFLGGMTFQRCSVWKNTVSLWEDVLRTYPRSGVPHVNLGAEAAGTGDIDGAFRSFDQAIRLQTDLSLAYSGRGSIYFTRKQYELAILDLDRALQLGSGNTDAWFYKGQYHRVKGENDKALFCFQQAIKARPFLLEPYLNQAVILSEKGRLAEALVSFDQALVFDPNMPRAHLGRASVLEQLGRRQDAIDAYQKYLNVGFAEPDAVRQRVEAKIQELGH